MSEGQLNTSRGGHIAKALADVVAAITFAAVLVPPYLIFAGALGALRSLIDFGRGGAIFLGLFSIFYAVICVYLCAHYWVPIRNRILTVVCRIVPF